MDPGFGSIFSTSFLHLKYNFKPDENEENSEVSCSMGYHLTTIHGIVVHCGLFKIKIFFMW